jgi:uncharacterized repeat protein (TIGR03803 family)
MKTCVKSPFVLSMVIAGLGLMLAGGLRAQTFTTLHSFTATSGSPYYTNSDGANPRAALLLSGNTLYGTAPGGGGGGSLDGGTVFAVSTDGTDFTALYTFKGGGPYAGLVLSGNILYGTTAFGGGNGSGTVFAVSIIGTGFTNLHTFSGSDGEVPEDRLILSGNTLYGTTYFGGNGFDGAQYSGFGTVFAVNTDSTGFRTLHSFTAIGTLSENGDGAYPYGGLVLSSNTLYGTTIAGGPGGSGTVFAIGTDGSGFTNLYNFTAKNCDPICTNRDGANPVSGLILSGNRLYGTATSGGSWGNGTVFGLRIDGTDFRTLYSFTATVAYDSSGLPLNSDGMNPYAGLALSGNRLYGTAVYGGQWGKGTVFAVDTDGSNFATLHSFTALPPYPGPLTNSDGANPWAGLVLASDTLYGTTGEGGTAGNGTVFSLTLPPPNLSIIASGAYVILTWPTNAPGFNLQSTTNLGSSAVWTTNLPGPLVVNGQNTVTNPISGTQQFFRLSQ